MKQIFPLLRQFVNTRCKPTALACCILVLTFLSAASPGIAQNNVTITCPASFSQNSDPGVCGAAVTFAATASGGQNITIVYNHDPSVFPVGTTNVVAKAVDDNYNELATCNFNVTVVNIGKPVISGSDITVSNTTNTCGAAVNFASPVVSVNCPTQTRTFSYTGAPQAFTVPAGVTELQVELSGASGGWSASYDGSAFCCAGPGGHVEANIPVTPGQNLTITVGGAGQNGSATTGGAGGYNGGGAGALWPFNFSGGGGGGATDIRTGAGSLSNRIVVAGGGGGGGWFSTGGSGGDLVGGEGMGIGTNAGGGTPSAGGVGGTYFNTYTGGNGALGVGGAGAAGTWSGGGGAGWYGGGGAAFGDGAGGSSYTIPTATNVVHYQNWQDGNGVVVIRWNSTSTLTQTAGLSSGAIFPVGTTVNTYHAVDDNGNSTDTSFTVTVNDIQDPSITAPANVVVNVDNNCNASNVALGTPTATDNCGISSVTNNAPATFSYGTTIITWTAADVHGNTSTATQTVTVKDIQAPSITAPANVVVNVDNNCSASNVAIGNANATDNCGVSNVTNNAPATFPYGTTTITWTATDVHGNTSTATQTVTVKDITAPVLTAPSAQSFNNGSGSYTVPALTASDNCGVASISYAVTGATSRTGTGANASGTFNMGTSTITWTVADVHGNTSTVSTTVTVSQQSQGLTLTGSIPAVWAVAPYGVANTIYIGYGPTALTISAVVTNGTPAYTYLWTKSGSTAVIGNSQSLVVSSAGTYSCKVTDAQGNTVTFNIVMKVEDVRCGNGDDKVAICMAANGKPKTICVSSNAVSTFLGNGNYLGTCGVARIVAPVAQAETGGEVTVVTSPNPAKDKLTVTLKNFKAANAQVVLVSANGKTVATRTVAIAGRITTLSFNTQQYAPGMYILKVITAEGVQTEKVIVQP